MGMRLLKIGGLLSMKRKKSSKCQKVVSCFLVIIGLVMAWVEGTSGETHPNLTTVETWGETQIKVTWEQFEDIENKPFHYELYIDNHLEYFGKDLVYVARRLTPDTLYHFKLRSCRQDTNKCTNYSKTLSGTTAQSRKRSFLRSWFQWLFLCSALILLACVTTIIGHRISRKLWRSFLYKYDYKSETNIGPKYLATTEIIDEDILLLEILLEKEKSELEGKKIKESKSVLIQNEMKKHDVHERNENIVENYLNKNENYKNIEKLNKETNLNKNQNLKNDENLKNEENLKNVVTRNDGNLQHKEHSINAEEISKSEDLKYKKYSNHDAKTDSRKNEYSTAETDNSKTKEYFKSEEKLTNVKNRTNEINSKKDSKKDSKSTYDEEYLETKQRLGHRRSTSLENQDGKEAEHFEQNIKNDNLSHLGCNNYVDDLKPVTLDVNNEIIVVIDNSNIFIGAQEYAHLLNPKERRRNIRIKIQHLVKILEKGRQLTQGFVQGSSPPTTDQVWEVYRRLGYCVDLEERRGKDEQRVDEGLHLNIYKALCDLSPRKLVIASGDGNKGKSEGATSLPKCAQAALEKGWLVEVHSWQHSLSTEWMKLSKKYPEHLVIHHLDRYVNYITFVDGKHGRKCQSIPTDLFKKPSVKGVTDITPLNCQRSVFG